MKTKLPQGRRLTTQRKTILKLLIANKGHYSAEEIYKVIRNKMPNISLGTVYRNLNFLAQHNYISEIKLLEKRKFEGVNENHYHLLCKNCGKIYNLLELPPLPNVEETVTNLTGHEISEYNLEFKGICKNCKEE